MINEKYFQRYFAKLLYAKRNGLRIYERVVGISESGWVWTNGLWLICTTREKPTHQMDLKGIKVAIAAGQKNTELKTIEFKYPSFEGVFPKKINQQITISAGVACEVFEAIRALSTKEEYAKVPITVNIGDEMIELKHATKTILLPILEGDTK